MLAPAAYRRRYVRRASNHVVAEWDSREGIDNSLYRNYLGYDKWRRTRLAGNTRFAVAVHVLGYMAYTTGASNTSEQIAWSVNTHPVVIRRLLASLRQAGLVASHPGPGGGWQLTRTSEQISLADVYRAIGHEALFTLPARQPDDDCDVGAHVLSVLDRLNTGADRVLVDHLATTSIADLVVEIARQVGPCAVKDIAHGRNTEGELKIWHKATGDCADGSRSQTQSGSP